MEKDQVRRLMEWLQNPEREFAVLCFEGVALNVALAIEQAIVTDRELR